MYNFFYLINRTLSFHSHGFMANVQIYSIHMCVYVSVYAYTYIYIIYMVLYIGYSGNIFSRTKNVGRPL